MKIKIGDTVMWRGAWGTNPSREARIKRIELCDAPGEKYGTEVEEIDVKDLQRSVFDLDNSHWAYGYQIDICQE